ncbi:MAG: hypothetical protein ABJG78_15125 [Cyclobacteriaceae bacterium]
MKSPLLILLLCLAFFSEAQQFSSEVFHQGFLVTSDRDTVRGKLKYDMETNIVSLVVGSKIRSFSSHKIFYFEINDQILNTYRQFYSIPSKVNFDYKIPILFELLYEGPLSLLTRESIIQQAQSANSPYWGGSNYPRSVVEYSFYFLDTKGEITYFTGRKKDLLLIMRKKQADIKKYMKDNRLDSDDVRDLIRITAFFNSI